MPFAITQSCCVDASCVAACPVNCIHPAPGEPDFATTDMLYIDPVACIDCGACAEVCPVDAVYPVDALTGSLTDYAGINAAHYPHAAPEPAAGSPLFHAWDPVRFDRVLPADFPRLEVAVVGSGPAGMYAAEDLLRHTTARVTIVDRLAEAGGLIRFGVAPDHQATKRIGEHFAHYRDHHRVRLRLGVEVGRDVTADELATEFDAVIYAVGASESRDLDLPGEDLPGHLASTTVVGWYNGHPEVPAGTLDLSGERMVVVGTGNVALDVARVVGAAPDRLADSAVPPPVLAALRDAGTREIVLLGRRGPEDASWTRGELLGLLRRDDLEVVVDAHDPRIGEAIDAASPTDPASLLRDVPRVRLDPAAPAGGSGGRRRVVLRFRSAPERVLGPDRVTGVRVGGVDGPVDLLTTTLVRAVGHRGRPVPGLPFVEDTGTVPHDGGRVRDRPGTYVVGWIKRGATGGIGANRADAAETVQALLADGAAGALGPGTGRGPRAVLRRAGRRVTRGVGRLTRP